MHNISRIDRERALFDQAISDFAVGRQHWQATSDSISDQVDRIAYLQGIASAWGAKNPTEALEYFCKQPLKMQCELAPEILGRWALQDTAAAVKWAASLTPGELKDLSYESIYRSWAMIAPEEAASHGLSIVDNSARNRALGALAREWSANDLTSATAWANNLSLSGTKISVLIAMANEIANRAPEQALQWASQFQKSSNSNDPSVISSVASQAGFVDPIRTFNWLASLPPSEENTSALAGVTAYVMEQSPQFAIETYPNLSAPIRDAITPAVANVLGMKSPETGQQWLQSVGDPNLRELAFTAFASGWATRDPAAASTWASAIESNQDKSAASIGLSSASE